MTKEEWLEKYYPTPASDCPAGDAAVEHSIRKWEGIAWAVENKFSVPVHVSSGTCALCYHHYDHYDHNNCNCGNCPLALSLGYACDAIEDTQGKEIPRGAVPWFAWTDNYDPMPMLNALKDIPPC